MSLSDIIAARRAAEEAASGAVPANAQESVGGPTGRVSLEDVTPPPSGSVTSDQPPAESPATAGAPESEGEAPVGVSQVVTPSGLAIYYQSGPKRLYRLRGGYFGDQTGDHYEDPDYPWAEVPSVSEVLSVLEKGGLSWWGMGVGVDGVQTLIDAGELVWVES